MSEASPRTRSLGLLESVSPSVDVEESDDCLDDFRSSGEADRGVALACEKDMETASVIDGDSGSMCFLSFIDWTIFSRPRDVMCFSRPRLLVRLPIEEAGDVRGMSRGRIVEERRHSNRSASIDATESTLADSSGMSFEPGRDLNTSIIGVVVS